MIYLMILAIVVVLIFIRIVTNSFSNVFQKQLANIGEQPAKINFLNYFLLSIVSIPIILLNNFSKFTPEFWKYALLGAIFGSICNCFMVLALKSGQLSVLGPINSYKAIIGLVFGMIILHEYPNIYGIYGMLLIILGTYFIFDNPKDFFKKDIFYRFCALFFSAIEAIFIKKVIILSSVTISFAASSILGALFSFFIMLAFNTNDKFKINAVNSKLYFSMAFCFGMMTFATAYVFSYINVGYALSLFQLSVLLNVFLGYKLFKEQNLLKKLAGSVVIIIGSILILLLGN